MLSVIVSAESENHLISVLEKVERLKENYNVEIGEVLIVDPATEASSKMPWKRLKSTEEKPAPYSKKEAKRFYDSIQQANRAGLGSKAQKLLANIGLKDLSFAPAHFALQHYKITYSPAWIVRFRKQEYVYEGGYQPTSLFTRQGQFIPPESTESK